MKRVGLASAITVSLALLLAACDPVTPPPPPDQTKVGLGVGVTNTVSCKTLDGQPHNGPATAITLALRDKDNKPIAAESNNIVNLTLSTPGGASYSFEQPYNLTAEDNVFQASENYFVLCQPPASGMYYLTGTINGISVSDQQQLAATTAPAGVNSSSTLTAQGLNTAQVKTTLPADTKVALVNYYRGELDQDGLHRGYRVGFGALNAPDADVAISSPSKPVRKSTQAMSPNCDSVCLDVPRSNSSMGNVTGTTDESPDYPMGGESLQRQWKRNLQPSSVLSVPVIFEQGRTAPASAQGMQSQAISGAQTIPLKVDAGHMRGETYYAEIISATQALGPSVNPDSLGRTDLQIQYVEMENPPPDNLTNAWEPRLSPAPMTATIALQNGQLTSQNYTTWTTSMVTGDGFPSAKDWNVKIRDGSNKVVWDYTYRAFVPYTLTASPAVATGAYQASFSQAGVTAKTAQINVPNVTPLAVPTDATMTLKSDLSGFTFKAPSGPYAHWVYVAQLGDTSTQTEAKLVAVRTCIDPKNGCDLTPFPGIALNPKVAYRFTTIATNTRLDLNPRLNSNEWNFSQPIRWGLFQKDVPGTGTQPAAPVWKAPTTVQIPSTNLGAQGKVLFELSNTGQAGTFTITSNNPAFTISPTTQALAAGGKVSISVQSTVCTTEGNRSGVLTIAGGGATSTVQVSQNCVKAAATAPVWQAVSSLTLPDATVGSTASSALQISNAGAAGTVSITSDNQLFSVTPSSLDIPASSTGEVVVNAAACTTTGTANGRLTLSGGGSTATVFVSRTCTQPTVPQELQVKEVTGLTKVKIDKQGQTKELNFGLFDKATGRQVDLGSKPIVWNPFRFGPGLIDEKVFPKDNGSVNVIGNGLGKFQMRAEWNSIKAESDEFLVWGMICSTGARSANRGQIFACNVMDKDGVPVTNSNIEVTKIQNSGGWNNGGSYSFAGGGAAGSSLNIASANVGTLANMAGDYSVKVTLPSGEVLVTSMSISAQNATLGPVTDVYITKTQVAADGPPQWEFYLYFTPPFGYKSVKVEDITSGVNNPILISNNSNGRVFIARSQFDFINLTKLRFTATNLIQDPSVVNPEIPDQYRESITECDFDAVSYIWNCNLVN